MIYSQLRAFHAVAAEGSFTKASARLRVVQPTLSGHVKALEERYGVVLFRRGAREIEITDFGRRLFDITQRFFAVEEEARRLLDSVGGLVEGQLRVGADSPFTVVPLLGRFTRLYPDVTKSVSLGNSRAVLDNILSGRDDVGILPGISRDRRLHIVPYLQDRLVVFVSRSHPWARRRTVRLQDLAPEVIVTREAGSTTRAVFEEEVARQGLDLKSTLEMGSREAVREAVAEGMGVGVVSESEFGHDDRLHKLTVTGANLGVVEYAVCRKDRRKDSVISAFFEVVDEMAEI